MNGLPANHTAERAMANVAIAAKKLSLAQAYAKKFNDAEALDYLDRVQRKYDEAYRRYTDPFGSKTYA